MQLNRGQYLYLVRIKENPGIISDHLAGMLNVDRTTTARSIKKLEQNQLIKKENDAENKKIKHLFVTDLGKRLAIKIEKENKIGRASCREREKRERGRCTRTKILKRQQV